MEVNDWKGLGRLIIFCPLRADNRVCDVNRMGAALDTGQIEQVIEKIILLCLEFSGNPSGFGWTYYVVRMSCAGDT